VSPQDIEKLKDDLLTASKSVGSFASIVSKLGDEIQADPEFPESEVERVADSVEEMKVKVELMQKKYGSLFRES